MDLESLHLSITRDELTAYSAMMIMSLIPIWIGSHLSLKQKGVETMSSSDAWKFPFIGSSVLFGLYLLFKLFSKEYINLLLTSYFLIFGILAVTTTIKPLFVPFFSKKMKPWKFSFMPFWTKKDPISVDFDKADIVAFVISSAIGVWYVMTKHWVSNNILGLAFSIQGIALLSLGSYKVGCILLGGLFFYDIFWVFGTDVMVTVAKSFDAPVKLLFPKELFAAEWQYSMIGLGDIVIPGIFIALLLRFDAFRAKSKKGKGKELSKTYFFTCYFGYILGLMTTCAVMHIFKAAQPALLYLVPACIGSSFGAALLRGEVPTLMAYTEEGSESKDKSQAEDKKSS